MRFLIPSIGSSMLLLLTGQECWPWLLRLASTSPTVMQVFAESVGSGLRHIVPDGLDHIVFLLGLFFLSRNFAGLLFQVTLFTLAHSLTLGVVVMTGLAAPEQWVEVAVGLSIAVVAIEGFFVNRALTKLRPYLVALFGCIHGLAFAHNLVVAPTTLANPIAALFGFNLGVELGQLVVVATAYLLLHPWWNRAWYQRRVALPACAVIATSGLAWAVQRSLEM